MSDAVTRLNAALEGRYAIERELGEDGVDDLNPITSVNYDVHPDGEEFVYIRTGAGLGGRPLIWILNWLEIVGEMTSAR